MSLVVAAIAAAGVGLAAGAIAVGTWLRRRARRAQEHAALPASGAAPHGTGVPAATASGSCPPAQGVDPSLPLGLGDMVQVGDETRWLCSGLRMLEGGAVRCAVWYAGQGDTERPVVAFAAPDRHIYWLTRVETALPDQPPSRVEIAGRLLDRVASFPAELEPAGQGAPALGPYAVITLYEGAVGDAAITIQGDGGTAVYGGPRIDDGDYDRLGTVDPNHGEPDAGPAGGTP